MGMMRFTNLHIPNDKLRGKRRPHHSWGQVSVFYLVIRVRYFIFSLQWGRRCRHMLCDRCIRKHKRLWSAFQLWVHLAEPGIQFINQIIIDILPMKHELGWWGSAHMLTPSSTGATGQHTTIFIANTRTLCNGSKLRLALNILGCLLRVFPCRRSVICYNPEHPTFPVEWWLPGDFDWLMVVLTAVPLLSLLVNDAVYLLKFDAADIAIGELLSVILAEETHRFLYRPYKLHWI